MDTQTAPENGQSKTLTTPRTMWAIKHTEKYGMRIIEVNVGAQLTVETMVWAIPVDRSGKFGDGETYATYLTDLFPTRQTAITELIARLKKTEKSIAQEIVEWSNEFKLEAGAVGAWQPGPLPSDVSLPYVAIFDNGTDRVLWTGSTPDREAVVAFFRLPPKPKLGYTKNAYLDLSGNPVGKYFWEGQGRTVNDASGMM